MSGQAAGEGATPPTGATPDGQQPAKDQQQKEPTPGSTPATPPATGDKPTDDPAMAAMTTDAGREALRREREGREDAERKLRELQPKLTEYEAAKEARATAEMTEVERRDRTISTKDARIAELEGELKTERVSNATAAIATTLGFKNPALAFRLLDVAKLEFDDTGKPKNIKAQLEKLLEQDPYLGATGDFGGGNRGTAPSTSDMNTLLRRRGG